MEQLNGGTVEGVNVLTCWVVKQLNGGTVEQWNGSEGELLRKLNLLNV